MYLVRYRQRWFVVVLGFLVLSVIAVALRVFHYPVYVLPDVLRYPVYIYVPHVLAGFLEGFAEPGELLWWITLGGVFEGYPSGITGYAVLVLGNTVFWVLVTAIGVVLCGAANRSLQRLRH